MFSPIARDAFNKYQLWHHGEVISPQFITHLNSWYHHLAASEFDRMESNRDNKTVQAYRVLASELNDQYQFIINAGVRVEPCKIDPYQLPRDVIRDIETNRRLKIYSDFLAHDMLSEEENFKFRACHDFYAHSAFGNLFGNNPLGEENAYRIHCAMLGPIASLAIATETRGQNSWFHFGLTNRGKPLSQKVFAPQKSIILSHSARWLYG